MELLTGTATVDDLDRFLSDLTEIGDEHDCTVQAFDARYVVGPEHLARAVELADRAIDRGENVARDRAVEILLYAAGRRQIDRALAMGVDAGGGRGDDGGDGTPVVVLVVGERGSPGATDPADRRTPAEREAAAAVAELPQMAPGEVEYGDPDRVTDFFSIGEAELAATTADLADLVLERVALLDVEK